MHFQPTSVLSTDREFICADILQSQRRFGMAGPTVAVAQCGELQQRAVPVGQIALVWSYRVGRLTAAVNPIYQIIAPVSLGS